MEVFVAKVLHAPAHSGYCWRPLIKHDRMDPLPAKRSTIHDSLSSWENDAARRGGGAVVESIRNRGKALDSNIPEDKNSHSGSFNCPGPRWALSGGRLRGTPRWINISKIFVAESFRPSDSRFPSVIPNSNENSETHSGARELKEPVLLKFFV